MIRGVTRGGGAQPGAESIGLPEARRIALAAQGFAKARPRVAGGPGLTHLRSVLDHTGLLQISRLGPYPQAALDRLAVPRRELFEYWGHEASLLPVEVQPLLRWRMQRARERRETWGGIARLATERPGYIAEVLEQVRAGGPVTAGHLAAGPKTPGTWWTWSPAKTALEYLFWCGEVTTHSRRGFERVYDLTERVLPPGVLAVPTPSEQDAHRDLLALAARYLGVATAGDLADYFRIRMPDARPRIAELVESGRLLPVTVRGWPAPAYFDPAARRPRRVHARALLAPFDPLIWERARTHRLFDFHYRIEIYVPAARRTHGYYVLPFLLGEHLVARVDLKSDRTGGRLLVRAAHAEPAAPRDTAAELAAELADMAGWLGLERVDAADASGDLAAALRAALTSG
jgi:uncharacterized protein YcaQ